TRVNEDFHFAKVQCAVARLWRRVGFGDEPSWPLAVQHFFAVSGNSEAPESAEERLRFASSQIKLGDSDGSLSFESLRVHDVCKEQCSGFARIQADVISRLDRQRDDALPDSIQVNCDL